MESPAAGPAHATSERAATVDRRLPVPRNAALRHPCAHGRGRGRAVSMNKICDGSEYTTVCLIVLRPHAFSIKNVFVGLVLGLSALCISSSSWADECDNFAAKSRHIITRMRGAAKKPTTGAAAEAQLVALCRSTDGSGDATLRTCVRDAATEAAVTQCWATAMRSYTQASKAAAPTPSAPLVITKGAFGAFKRGSKVNAKTLASAFAPATITAVETNWLIRAADFTASANSGFLSVSRGTVDLFGVGLGDTLAQLTAPETKRLTCEAEADVPLHAMCYLPWLTLRLACPTATSGYARADLAASAIKEIFWLTKLRAQ